ncbi:unnamed protein product [Enterobius vermicularis]|uniref:Ovule protein n=1 Tax=Enterobius vermicularis TaxID=51028 RepID=A0A0N4VQF3_ENTVE|nr:unnamed protein product [Enterobius vermicularis]
MAANFTSEECPTIRSIMPPVSFSISTEPQKYFWLFVMFIHVPGRLLVVIVSYIFLRAKKTCNLTLSLFLLLPFIFFSVIFTHKIYFDYSSTAKTVTNFLNNT